MKDKKAIEEILYHTQSELGRVSSIRPTTVGEANEKALQLRHLKEKVNLINWILEDPIDGVDIIRKERERQILEEGFSSERDDRYVLGELAIAASCYAYPYYNTDIGVQSAIKFPFKNEWWKPSPDNRIRELAKAGALIAADIDRILRKEKELYFPEGKTE